MIKFGKIFHTIWFCILLFYSYSQPNKPIAVIPFEYSSNRIFLKYISVNGNDSLIFVFDSGAQETVITQALVDKLNLKSDTTTVLEGVGGEFRTKLYVNNNISINNILIENINFTLLPFSNIKTNSNKAVSGIIGVDLLKRFVTKVNFDKSCIELYDTLNFKYNDKGVRYGVYPFYEIARINTKITTSDNKEAYGLFGIDMGNPGSLLLFQDQIKENLLENKSNLETIEIGGIGTLKRIGYKRNDIKIDLCNTLLTEQSAIIFENSFIPDSAVGHIGMKILEKFNIVFDNHKRHLYLEPNKSFQNKQNISIEGTTDIKTIIKNENLEKLKLILDKSPKRLNETSQSGWTPLHYASFNNKAEIVKYLISLGAKLNIQELKNGATPLHFAVYNDNDIIAKILIEAGANTKVKDKMGLTATDMAKMMNKTKVLELFANF